MEQDKVGYKSPPKSRQFGQPNGNPSGITSESRQRQIENAEKATEIRMRLLDAVLAKLNDIDIDEAVAMVDNHINTLIKDTENRGLGMPTQQVDTTSSDGSMSPAKIVINGVKPKGNDDE